MNRFRASRAFGRSTFYSKSNMATSAGFTPCGWTRSLVFVLVLAAARLPVHAVAGDVRAVDPGVDVTEQDDEIRGEVEALFEQFVGSLQSGRALPYVRCFHWPTLLEALAGEQTETLTRAERVELFQAFVNGIQDFLDAWSGDIFWQAADVHRIEHGEAGRLLVRVNFARGDDIFPHDVELLQRGQSLSITSLRNIFTGADMMLETANAMEKGVDDTALTKLIQSEQFILEGQVNEALKQLDELRGQTLTPGEEYWHYLNYGVVYDSQGRYEEALKHLVAAEEIRPGTPAVAVVAARILIELDSPERAVERINVYADVMGEDAESHFLRGNAYLQMEQWDDAAAEFTRSLELNNHWFGSLSLLGNALMPEESHKLSRWFELYDLSSDLVLGELHAITDAWIHLHLPEHAALLANHLLKHDPLNGQAALDLTEAKLVQGNYDHAIDVAATYLDRVDPRNVVPGLIELACIAALEAGEPVVGYERLHHHPDAFRVIGGILRETERFEELNALIAVQNEHDPDNPYPPLFRAEMLIMDGKHERAIELLASALDNHQSQQREDPHFDDDVIRIEHLARLAYSHVLLDQVEQAYIAFDRTADIAHALGEAAMHLGDIDALRLLIDLRREAHPKDLTISVWDAEIAMSEFDCERVIEVLAPVHRALHPDSEHYFLATDYLVRCSIRIGELQRAYSAAETHEQAVSDPYFRLLVAIADGNTDLATQLMYTCMEYGYSPHAIFQDPDAEHSLLQPAFMEFRQTFYGQ